MLSQPASHALRHYLSVTKSLWQLLRYGLKSSSNQVQFLFSELCLRKKLSFTKLPLTTLTSLKFGDSLLTEKSSVAMGHCLKFTCHVTQQSQSRHNGHEKRHPGTALGCSVASSLVLIPTLRRCFSEEAEGGVMLRGQI